MTDTPDGLRPGDHIHWTADDGTPRYAEVVALSPDGAPIIGVPGQLPLPDDEDEDS